MISPGRPEIGRPVNIRLGEELLTRVDHYAQSVNISRAEAIRELIQRGLRRKGKPRRIFT